VTFPDEPKPRIEPLSTEGLSAEALAVLARIPGQGLKGEGFPRNVLGVLMHSPDVLAPFLEYWVTSKTALSLSVREQELVILRMAVLYRSDYVWKHHVKVGREFGVTDEELQALREGACAAFQAPREAALLELTGAFVDQRCLPPALWQRSRAVLGAREHVDLISLVSQYVLFALANVCTQVQLEPAVAALPGIDEHPPGPARK
jgi:4-carboxymuconolactone decarboxylase